MRDVWYVGSALTRFEGRSAHDLRRAIVGGRTRAHVQWAWTVGKLPRHLTIQLWAAARFLRRSRRSCALRGTVPHLTRRTT